MSSGEANSAGGIAQAKNRAPWTVELFVVGLCLPGFFRPMGDQEIILGRLA
jgi:hypothetical protein